MLPPNALRYLKGHRDGLVYVVLTAISVGAGTAVDPWVGVATLLVSGVLYHLRCERAEHHMRAMGRQKLDEKALAVEAAKARYRELVVQEQPSLPLPKGVRRTTEPGTGPSRRGKDV